MWDRRNTKQLFVELCFIIGRRTVAAVFKLMSLLMLNRVFLCGTAMEVIT
jgi:hypothetical protein